MTLSIESTPSLTPWTVKHSQNPLWNNWSCWCGVSCLLMPSSLLGCADCFFVAMEAHDRPAALEIHIDLLSLWSHTDDIGLWMSRIKLLIMRTVVGKIRYTLRFFSFEMKVDSSAAHFLCEMSSQMSMSAQHTFDYTLVYFDPVDFSRYNPPWLICARNLLVIRLGATWQHKSYQLLLSQPGIE